LKKWENIAVRLALGVLLALILLGILFLRPFFGLMDDHYNLLTVVPDMKNAGIFSYSWKYALSDLSWGMFRPTNPLMIFFLYAPIPFAQPWLLYLWNAILCFGLLLLGAKVWEKLLAVPAGITLLFLGSFFYLYDLFQHPSLQEKMILLFGFLSLFILSRDRVTGKHLALALLCCVCGVLAKASFIIYFSMGVWVIFWHPFLTGKKERWFYTGIYVVALVCATVFFAYISSRGGYTANSYSLAKVVPNLQRLDGVMFVGGLGIFFAGVFFRKEFFRRPWMFTPAIGTLAFLTVFLPWGITGYIQTVVGPIFCLLFAVVAWRIFPEKLRMWWILPLCLFALAVGGYRSYTMFGRLADLGLVVQRAPEWQERGIAEIFLPCAEGTVALRRYLQEIAGVSIQTKEISSYSPADLEGKWIFFDQAMCPLPGRVAVMDGCSATETAFVGRFAKSYRLERWSCAR
jgi:hypothetical protein